MTGLRCFEVEGVNDGNAIIALHADMGFGTDNHVC